MAIMSTGPTSRTPSSSNTAKFATFLRNELCPNTLADFGRRKGLDHLDAGRRTFPAITGRFAGFQAQWLNVHVDFALLQRIALPIMVGAVRYLRNQNPRRARHSPARSAAAWRHSRRRLERQRNPPSCARNAIAEAVGQAFDKAVGGAGGAV